MTLSERARRYQLLFPNYPPLASTEEWLYGIWMIGNFYKRKYDYYGAYPPSYLKRIYSLFPDKKKILHLFSGMIDRTDARNGIRFDIKAIPDFTDIVGDVNQIHNIFKAESFDLILADPPYTKEDAKKYNAKPINKRQIIKQLYQILKPGGHLVWLDLSIPIYSKINFKLVGTIGLLTGTNRKIRIISIFERN